ncbi:MAG: ABC transporter permease [Trueperaceae bacterium]|nr:ABC transporter permease [Trueperaceae bacterium]
MSITSSTTPPATKTTPSRTRNTLSNLTPPAITFVVTIALWQAIITLFDIPPYLVPGPLDVVNALRESWRTILNATWMTFQASAYALLISVVLGVSVALILASSKRLYKALFPYTVVLQTTPVIAVAPIIVVWFGIGMSSITTVGVIISVFPIIANTTTGLLSTDPNLLQLFRLYNASRWQILTKLRLPYALPYFFAGARVAAGLAVIGAIVGEYVAGMGGKRGGLGFVIVESANRLRMGQVFAATLASAILGVLFLVAINTLSHVVLKHWHASAAKHEG